MSSFSFLKPPASSATSTGGLFGSAPAQPSGGLFGSLGGQQQPQQQSGGLFSNTTGQQQSSGLFSNTQNQQQPSQQTGGLFANTQTQQQPQQQSNGLFGGLGNSQSQFNKPNQLNLNSNSTQSSNQRPSTQPQIDVEHIRPTTKFDHLTPALQSEIEALDTHILNEIHKCNELSDALPAIMESGQCVPEDYAYVKEKFDELELALENDAADIVDLRDNTVRRDVAEGRLCWKSVDRLKMPHQYQQSQHHGRHGGRPVTETVYGGSGLSGWWNNPTVSTRTRHGAQKNVVSVDADEDVEVAKGSLVDLLTGRADEMREMLRENREMLGEIEQFVGTVEGKIVQKERELIDGSQAREGERERQIKMLRYVFGEVERSLYEVADRVGQSRDGLMELGERSARVKMAF